ncbi:MAG: hypothetical protein D4R67_07765 [Bacteroidetes bacterium]|nr:MAG: hypothetical protein D4R67_07765 [Bacteroidota bacterium]
MIIEIDISDLKLNNLSNSANTKLKEVSEKYIEDVLDEAARLEASRNNSGNNPEITAAIVLDAVEFTKKFRFSKKKSTKKVIFQLLAFISTVCTGGLFKPVEFAKVWYAIIFLVVFLLAILFNLIIYLYDTRNE